MITMLEAYQFVVAFVAPDKVCNGEVYSNDEQKDISDALTKIRRLPADRFLSEKGGSA